MWVDQPLRPVDCLALPYPGFPTDLQAQLTALLCLVPGKSLVTDKVFPSRFMHVSELLRMGADIRRDGENAVITGVPQLSGAHVMASDLRASAALVLAGLAAQGETVVHRIYHLDRGYESLESKLVTPERAFAGAVRRRGRERKNSPVEFSTGLLIPAGMRAPLRTGPIRTEARRLEGISIRSCSAKGFIWVIHQSGSPNRVGSSRMNMPSIPIGPNP